MRSLKVRSELVRGGRCGKHGVLQERGIRLVFAEMVDDIRCEFRRYGIEHLVGSDAFFTTVQILEDYREASVAGA